MTQYAKGEDLIDMHACGAARRSRAQAHRHRRRVRLVQWAARLGTPPGLLLEELDEHCELWSTYTRAETATELWSQYSDDVKESSEATALMETLNKSYDEFLPKVQSAVGDVASKMNLNRDQAANFAGQILHAVAEMQTDNVKHAKKIARSPRPVGDQEPEIEDAPR